MIKCTFENGQSAHLRHVTVDALIEKDNRLLLVRRDPDFWVEPGKYVLPGGYLDRDETADQGIVREVLEETGYRSNVIDLYFIIHQPRLQGDDRQNVGFIFRLEAKEQIQKPDHEIESVHWFDEHSLPTNETIGFDHARIINTYLKHKQNSSGLPIINPF